MNKSDVYIYRFRNEYLEDRLIGFNKVIEKIGFPGINPDDSTAVKVHFGEPGCKTFLNSSYAKQVINKLINHGSKPFLTDSNTLYKGKRSNGTDHRNVAIKHGFGEEIIGAPIVIADGENSTDVVELDVNLKYFKTVKIGEAVHNARSMVVLSHFKGHLLFGFGGALKNVGMGIGARSAKQMMHADVKPELTESNCISCGTCVDVCPVDAVAIDGSYPVFDYNLCEGCAECITMCPEDALKIQWNGSAKTCMEKTAETCYAILKEKKNKVVYFNVIIDVTPDCDCFPQSDIPLVHDIGVVASLDPVAIDKASLDLVTASEGNRNSKLNSGFDPGEDKFKAFRPDIDGEIILKYAESIGIGSMKYNLIEIE